jgi:hypothetical protein
MRPNVAHFAALLLGIVGAASVYAQYQPPYPTPVPPARVAPDACGPGFYDVNPWGAVYGPNYYLQPPFMPYQGAIFGRQAAVFPGGGQAGPGGPGGPPMVRFPTHPYARSPRDFFMME